MSEVEPREVVELVKRLLVLRGDRINDLGRHTTVYDITIRQRLILAPWLFRRRNNFVWIYYNLDLLMVCDGRVIEVKDRKLLPELLTLLQREMVLDELARIVP
jgi:hypothetical protein